MKINKIKTKKLTWIHINRPDKESLNYLRGNYDFHPLDLEDCLTKVQRPQISEYAHYIFFILTFPVYNRQSKEIESSEVDFFIGSKYLVTIADGGVDVVDRFFNEMKNDEYTRGKYLLSPYATDLLYEILHRLQNYTFPMLDHVSQDIESIEKRIFFGEHRELVREILYVKRNIVDFRRIMQAHKNIIKKLMSTHNNFFMHDKMNIYFSNILDRTKDIWDILETQKENINAFQETHESLISYRLNDIMKTLTIISVIIIPANLIATIFGMNVNNTPLVGQKQDFAIVMMIIFSTMLAFLLYFRTKKWL